ncbi:hypothetical protein DVH02_28850 [Streptomyces corynorhini]|uniref:L,D-transpeptidase n=1 Tax=Streptomyces corynorhini TaxID=2282652 RepID=A0A370B297_9ACTN|nr:hypothetical protein DVH02_28850 [Streptomyces corynorhini]
MPSWAWVTALTAGALAAVTVLAVQAGSGPRPPAVPTGQAKPTAKPSPSATVAPGPSETAKREIPTSSGEGRRIVYSLGEQRVWLVDPDNNYDNSFAVWPGTISPEKGPYAVSFRREEAAGSDGVDIRHVVYFAVKDGLSVAFSHAVDGASPQPAPGASTGGIRVGVDAGEAIWKFAALGTKISVVD